MSNDNPPIDVSQEYRDFEAWHAKEGQTADYINGSDKHRAWMAWLARATAGVLVVPTTDDQLRSGIAAYLCGAGLDMKLAEDMAPDLLRYARTGAWSGTPGVSVAPDQTFCDQT